MARDTAQLFKKGTLEMLVLLLLRDGDFYGYQITQMLNERSEGLFPIQEGSLYPVLYRLVREELVSSYERPFSGRIRVYYRLEPSGREWLKKLTREYQSLTKGIANVLRRSGGEEL